VRRAALLVTVGVATFIFMAYPAADRALISALVIGGIGVLATSFPRRR
jgi:hypothetical protein